MSKVNYLHIMVDSIYCKDYTEKINRLYNGNEHFFLIHQHNTTRKYNKKNCVAVNKVGFKLMMKIIYMALKAKTVIFHSLYIDKKMYIIFAVLSCIMTQKFMWFIWSADLYNEHEMEMKIKGFSLKKRIKRLARKVIIHNLKAIIVVAEGDYNQTKKWYRTKAKMLQAEYAYNLIEVDDLKNDSKSTIKILAGHEADEACCHKRLFKRLEFCKDKNVEIITILSYPRHNLAYIDDVIITGKHIFGDKFFPVIDWMPYEAYIELLNSIDIAVFEMDIQMGAGNIFNLLYLGKKVYISDKNSIYEQLIKQGMECFSKQEIDPKTFFQPLTDEEKKNNRKKIADELSDSTFKRKWNKVFQL